MENEKVIQEGFVISDGSLEESKQIQPEHELINSWTVQPNRYSNNKPRWSNYKLKARNARKTFMERNYDEAKTFKGKSLDRMKIDHNDVDTTQKDKFQYHSETDLGLKEIYKQILNLTDDGKITLPKSTRKEVESLFRNRPNIKNPYKAFVLQSMNILGKSTNRNPGRGKHSEKIIRNNIHDNFKRDYCTAQRDESSTDKLLGGKVTITQHSKPNLTDDEIEDYFGESQEVDELSVWKPPMELTRGETGVYDIDQLVLLLKEQKAKDICVIRMPSFLHLSDFMVIATGRSPRQSAAIMATVKYMGGGGAGGREGGEREGGRWKKEGCGRGDKGAERAGTPCLLPTPIKGKDEWEGEEGGSWREAEGREGGRERLGGGRRERDRERSNIILHLMSEEVREYYDLETLWTVGQEFEDNSLEEDDRYNLSDSDLDWLKEYDVNSQKNNK
ncbi:hypothetical protein FSP39_013772 [Pinctada imbricata]|uniref:Uncharacterized protein n=1 Tax=Pinctada imbricata TaxID=66713 RepID=A0AA88XUB9_PINIB|nr:hypothetical protein FSP39_013772 [Pinctada imbricata]